MLNVAEKPDIQVVLDPGTVTQRGLRSFQTPGWRQASSVSARGAAPEPLKPATWRPSSTRQNRSPPTPVDIGCTTPRTASDASAASIAVPPSARAHSAASTARGLDVATIAPLPHDGEPI